MMNLTIEQIEASYPVICSGEYVDVRAYWIPMKYHAEVIKAYRDAGIKIRARFRGPRDSNRMMKAYDGRMYRRGKYSARYTCLKDEATHFTIYARD